MKKYKKIFFAIFTAFLFTSLSLSKILAAPSNVNLGETDGGGGGSVARKTIDTEGGWEAERKYVESMVDAKGENTVQFNMKSMYSIINLLFVKTCPSCTKDAGQRVAANPEIPDELKAGVIDTVDKGITAMIKETPSVNVVAHLANEWVPGYSGTTSVYADGYDDLKNSNVIALWSKVRNISYVIYVVIMIAIGFMIMFRHKIGGQMMVTLGNSIPKLIVSLVLVTFSFAIMGLLIDLGGLIMKLVAFVIYGEYEVKKGVTLDNPITLFGDFFKGSGGNFFGETVFGKTGLAGIVTGLLEGLIGSNLISKGLGWIAGGIVTVLFGLIIIGVVLVGAFKLWFTMIKAYVSLIINVIVSPFLIMLGAFPGNSHMTLNVFKSAFRSILVFPIAFGIVNLPYMAELDGIKLGFPSSLTNSTGDVAVSALILGVVKIFAVYAAASAPEIALAIIPSTESKATSDAMGAMKTKMSGVPFVGSLFK